MKTFCSNVIKEVFLLQDKDIYFLQNTQLILKKFISEKTTEMKISELYNILYTFRKFKFPSMVKKGMFRYTGFHSNINVYHRLFFTLENQDANIIEIHSIFRNLFPIILNVVSKNENLEYTLIKMNDEKNESVTYNQLIVYEFVKISKIILYYKNSEIILKENVENLMKLLQQNCKIIINFSE